MKQWQTAVIPDEETYQRYVKGEAVQVSVLVFKNWLKEFEPGNHIQIYFKTTAGKEFKRGRIINNLGTVQSFPEGEPEAFRIVVQCL